MKFVRKFKIFSNWYFGKLAAQLDVQKISWKWELCTREGLKFMHTLYVLMDCMLFGFWGGGLTPMGQNIQNFVFSQYTSIRIPWIIEKIKMAKKWYFRHLSGHFSKGRLFLKFLFSNQSSENFVLTPMKASATDLPH